jgi:hypothetical protein
MNKGGKTSTTWASGSSWRAGETKVIRVPVALADEIMAYARALDSREAMLHGNSGDATLVAIALYIGWRRGNRHTNQHQKELDTSTRAWDELRKFWGMVQREPEKLGFKNE